MVVSPFEGLIYVDNQVVLTGQPDQLQEISQAFDLKLRISDEEAISLGEGRAIQLATILDERPVEEVSCLFNQFAAAHPELDAAADPNYFFTPAGWQRRRQPVDAERTLGAQPARRRAGRRRRLDRVHEAVGVWRGRHQPDGERRATGTGESGQERADRRPRHLPPARRRRGAGATHGQPDAPGWRRLARHDRLGHPGAGLRRLPRAGSLHRRADHPGHQQPRAVRGQPGARRRAAEQDPPDARAGKRRLRRSDDHPARPGEDQQRAEQSRCAVREVAGRHGCQPQPGRPPAGERLPGGHAGVYLCAAEVGHVAAGHGTEAQRPGRGGRGSGGQRLVGRPDARRVAQRS